MGKADGYLSFATSLTIGGGVSRSSSKRFRLGFAAGFRGLRCAVPLRRIKAKKIPIVQTNLTFWPSKID
ncbi:hypothetical protein GR197_17840 [Rhizobium phaseoli]|uniref:Uncharacterized protein n=1 Tax=Rhizobium phaseoli TaxID=396 RepID=A0A7K3UFC1_9HYPH|nr:hypothetical protein [Rhizobium phaseoli]NEJ72377.1 hypothetical protein [Rhizobium phaseoli]